MKNSQWMLQQRLGTYSVLVTKLDKRTHLNVTNKLNGRGQFSIVALGSDIQCTNKHNDLCTSQSLHSNPT